MVMRKASTSTIDLDRHHIALTRDSPRSEEMIPLRALIEIVAGATAGSEHQARPLPIDDDQSVEDLTADEMPLPRVLAREREAQDAAEALIRSVDETWREPAMEVSVPEIPTTVDGSAKSSIEPAPAAVELQPMVDEAAVIVEPPVQPLAPSVPPPSNDPITRIDAAIGAAAHGHVIWQVRYEIGIKALNDNAKSKSLLAREAAIRGIPVKTLAAEIVADRDAMEERVSAIFAERATAMKGIQQSPPDQHNAVADDWVRRIQKEVNDGPVD